MDDEAKRELRKIRYSVQAVGWVVTAVLVVLLLT